MNVSQQAAARELLRRRRARLSLVDYVNAIDVPGKPASGAEDEWLFKPVETTVAAHHRLILSLCQDLAEVRTRQAMIFAPPGSAKSTYASVVFPTWYMGREPDRRIILSSYASDIARKQGRRARQIVRSGKYTSLFGAGISNETSAADEWALTNGSEFMAGGILSGITGNRAHGLIIDDPVKGRDEADSEVIRDKTREAYEDDLTTRLIPGGWTLIIQTRWNHGDLSGMILPEDWAGESGDFPCRDGLVWRVLCLPAIAERHDDPLGRAPGEPLWPEWFKDGHFERYKRSARTWSALYQQRPTPEEGDYFQEEWFRPVANLPDPKTLAVYGGSDYAVTDGDGDYTVHVVLGLDAEERIYILDVWRQQASSDKWVDAFCDLVLRHKPVGWAEEQGQIKAGVGPFLAREQRKRRAFVAREQFPTRGNKAVRAQSIRGRAALNGIYYPADAPWWPDLRAELLTFPAGKHDDQVDALGLVGQLLDKMFAHAPDKPEAEKPLQDYRARDDASAAGDWMTY